MSTPSPSDMHPSSGLIDPDRALHELALATTRVREAIPAAIPDGEPAAPVPTCPGWDAVALVEHLGGAHLWAAGAVRTGQRPGGMPTRDEDVRTLQQWYADAARELLDTLAEVPADTPAWTFAAGDRTAGFWRRRQLHETLVHAVDLALAGPRVDDLSAGQLYAAVAPEVVADGIDEILGVFLPRMAKGAAGRVAQVIPAAQPVALNATDAGRAWTLRTDDHTLTITTAVADDAAAVFSGTAAALNLALWRRAGWTGIERSGDTAVADAFVDGLRLP
jgi:uncharacterized protein (TIGR03083 family)